MYGTVARLQVKPGSDASLNELTRSYNSLQVPGFLASYLYQTNAATNEYYLTVIFESKTSYTANAESPEQNARYLQMRELLAIDPEWHDGEITTSAVAGV
jgi:heme-degrading monooxygenase HmoA